MKMAPVHAALARVKAAQVIVHTGQHYDAAMSDVFFKQLRIPAPNHNLEVGSGTHAVQTADVMLRLEPLVLKSRPDWVLVYGDVNSTLAATLVCVKLGIRVAHVEAGLRSRDREMPEEHNRIATDHLADLLFTPSSDGDDNLRAEGIARKRIRRVGNVMIDTLVQLLPEAMRLTPLGLGDGCPPFVLVTLHRPSNVDDPRALPRLMEALGAIAAHAPVIFPMHPRTKERLKGRGFGRIQTVSPLGYLDFLALQARAALVVTDSGGIQEETTFLGVPCLTVRGNTERPITISVGTNELVGTNPQHMKRRALAILRGGGKRGRVPPLWDGRAAERIAAVLAASVRRGP